MGLFRRKPEPPPVPACQHHWDAISASQYGPVQRETKVPHYLATRDFLDELMYGVTIIYHRCDKCGAVETTRVTGKYTPPGMTPDG